MSAVVIEGGHRGPPLQTTYVTRRRGRPPCRPVVGVCTPVVPLIRHGCAMPPSPLRGEGDSRSVGSAQMSIAFPSSVTAAQSLAALLPYECGVPLAGAYAVPPSPGGRWPRRGRMRVSIVECGGHRTGGWGHPPLHRVTIDFVGAAVPSGPSITGAPPWSPSGENPRSTTAGRLIAAPTRGQGSRCRGGYYPPGKRT